MTWDVSGSTYSYGAEPILYPSTGWGNQRFVVHKVAMYSGFNCFTISPLEAPHYKYEIDIDYEDERINLGFDNNTSQSGYLSNKFIFEKLSHGYAIRTGVSLFQKFLIPDSNNFSSGNHIVQKIVPTYETNLACQWLFCKTDTLGNDLQNKTFVNGTSVSSFNITPPALGEFYIETSKFSSNIDTYIELRDSNNQTLAYNDDIDGSSNRFSRILYNFSSFNDFKLYLRGYSNSDTGYVYLTFRPKNPLYFAAVYDFDQNNNDRYSALRNTEQYLNNYFLTVECNAGKNSILEFASNGKQKINSDYFIFSGHGFSNLAGVQFYNSIITEDFFWYDIPSLSGTSIAIWMSCHGARNYFKYGNSGALTSMAYQSVAKGADYSLGYVGTIYDTTQNAFPEYFFKAISEGYSIEEAVTISTEWVIDHNFWWWTFFGSSRDDFINPVLYKNGDLLKLSCGNGLYNSNGEQSSANSSVFDLTKLYFVDNLTSNVEDTIKKIDVQYNGEINQNLNFIFKSVYNGKEIHLGFKVNEDKLATQYYDLDENKLLDAKTFEMMLGEPSSALRERLISIRKQ